MLLRQGVGGVPDLPLAAEENQDVAGPRRTQLVHRGRDRFRQVAFDHRARTGVGVGFGIGVGRHDQWPVADLHRKGAAGDLDHRRVAEMAREALRVDRRRGDDHLQVGPSWQELPQVAEDKVDVEAAFVGLVDDQRVVLAQQPISLHLCQQDAVRHQLDQAVAADLVGEPHLVADGSARPVVRTAEFLGDAFGHRACGQAPRLGVTDQPAHAPAEFQADLRELRRLAGTGLTSQDHDLVVADRGEDLVLLLTDRQVRGIGDLRHGREPLPYAQRGRLDIGGDLSDYRRTGLGVAYLARAVDTALQAALVTNHQIGQAFGQVGERRHQKAASNRVRRAGKGARVPAGRSSVRRPPGIPGVMTYYHAAGTNKTVRRG